MFDCTSAPKRVFSSELESKEGVYSLEGWQQTYLERAASHGSGSSDECVDISRAPIQIQSDGVRDESGRGVAADNRMPGKPLDLSALTLEWVESTQDPLFVDLSNESTAKNPGVVEWRLTERASN
jgi:hypothetical protein